MMLMLMARSNHHRLEVLLCYLGLFALLTVTLWSGELDGRCLAVPVATAALSGNESLDRSIALFAVHGAADDFGDHIVCRPTTAAATSNLADDDDEDGAGGGLCSTFRFINAGAAKCPAQRAAERAGVASTSDETYCVDVGAAPHGGLGSFDDWPTALLTLFVVTTLDDWAAIMWRVQRVTNSWLPLLIFVTVVLAGTCMIFNLLIAEMLTRFQAAIEAAKDDNLKVSSWEGEGSSRVERRARPSRVLLVVVRRAADQQRREEGPWPAPSPPRRVRPTLPRRDSLTRPRSRSARENGDTRAPCEPEPRLTCARETRRVFARQQRAEQRARDLALAEAAVDEVEDEVAEIEREVEDEVSSPLTVIP